MVFLLFLWYRSTVISSFSPPSLPPNHTHPLLWALLRTWHPTSTCHAATQACSASTQSGEHWEVASTPLGRTREVGQEGSTTEDTPVLPISTGYKGLTHSSLQPPYHTIAWPRIQIVLYIAISMTASKHLVSVCHRMLTRESWVMISWKRVRRHKGHKGGLSHTLKGFRTRCPVHLTSLCNTPVLHAYSYIYIYMHACTCACLHTTCVLYLITAACLVQTQQHFLHNKTIRRYTHTLTVHLHCPVNSWQTQQVF